MLLLLVGVFFFSNYCTTSVATDGGTNIGWVDDTTACQPRSLHSSLSPPPCLCAQVPNSSPRCKAKKGDRINMFDNPGGNGLKKDSVYCEQNLPPIDIMRVYLLTYDDAPIRVREGGREGGLAGLPDGRFLS